VKFRELLDGVKIFARSVVDRGHPILAQIVPMRRCNLACTYCNEYDKTSSPVPLDEVMRWLDKLSALRTEVVTLSGGEPMLHPDIDAIVRGIRDREMIAGVITNGYFLQPDRIDRLNAAGLQYLQVSIDNVEPDEVSKKSLRLLEPKLQNLAAHAKFQVNINSVVGGGCANPMDAVTIARRARELGFSTSIGVIHDGSGHLKALSPTEREAFEQVTTMDRGSYSRINSFQENLVSGKPNDWQCRAGARYLYICENGLVHHCSQQRGIPGTPLADYTSADILREWETEKPCAPYCTIGCVHRVSVVDKWRMGSQTRRSASAID
jgi:MoaA/NifB/PqqE/SkfB family radical SAM enzyme